MQLTAYEMQQMLAALVDTGAPWDPAAVFVGVGTAIADHGQDTVRADITPGLGTSGTATAVTTWSSPYRMNDGRWAIEAPVKHFTIASGADHCVLVVWYLATLATLGNLIGYGGISPAVELVDEHSLFSLVVRLVIDPSGRWSSEIMWNG